MKMNFKRGFTLIELLVVVAIIGILASVVLASLNTDSQKGQTAAFKAEMNGLRANIVLVCDGVLDSAAEVAYPGGTTFVAGTVDCLAAGSSETITPITGKGATCTQAVVTESTISFTPSPSC